VGNDRDQKTKPYTLIQLTGQRHSGEKSLIKKKVLSRQHCVFYNGSFPVNRNRATGILVSSCPSCLSCVALVRHSATLRFLLSSPATARKIWSSTVSHTLTINLGYTEDIHGFRALIDKFLMRKSHNSQGTREDFPGYASIAFNVRLYVTCNILTASFTETYANFVIYVTHVS